MKIEYKSVTGNIVALEVDDELGNIILEIEHTEELNNRAQTRRHESLSSSDKDLKYKDKSVNIDDTVLKNLDQDKLYEAIATLKPKEQKLLHMLYLNENPISQSEYAKELDIKVSTVWKRAERVRNKLKELLK